MRAARQFAVTSPEAEGTDTALVELAVSELASNAVLHARTPFTVTVERLDDGVRISVTDGDPSVPTVRHVEPDAVTGRGMAIVESISRHMEVEPTESGKTVRFEIGWAAS